MQMIEKMARAMAVANNDYDGDYLCWSAYENDARAALEALLEPSEAMVEVFNEYYQKQYNPASGYRASHTFKAMIQAALEEK